MMAPCSPRYDWLASAALAGLLAACSPPATYEPAPDTEPVVEIAESETGARDVEVMETAEAHEGEETEHDDHDHDEDHETHDDDEDHEDHEEHDHDEHFVGEAHVHGAAELAVTVDAHFVTVSLEAPLANFGLSEGKTHDEDALSDLTEGLVELLGTDRCDLTEQSATPRSSGDHAAISISIVWDCYRPSQLDGLKFIGFETYPGFESVDAIYLSGTDQTAQNLTPSDPVIAFD